LPTALKAQELKTYTVHAPINPQIKISGYVRSMYVIFLTGLRKLTSSMNALKRRKAAIEADPTE
jgi:hypothetical protein